MDILPLVDCTAAGLRAWAKSAPIGSGVEYFRGDMACDVWREHHRREGAKGQLCDTALKLAADPDLGLHLFQRRYGPGDYGYLAVKLPPAVDKKVRALPSEPLPRRRYGDADTAITFPGAPPFDADLRRARQAESVEA